jgi:hypothetical protein
MVEIHGKQDQDSAQNGGTLEKKHARLAARCSRGGCQGRTAKKCGYVEYDQINALLATEEVSSEQIENIFAKFSEMGINVVETKEALREKGVAAGEELEDDEGKWKARTS